MSQSKAERILDLLAQGKRPSEIAKTVGCLTAYVRVVRQREQCGSHMTPSGRAWVERNIEKVRAREAAYKKRRYANDPVYRERSKAAHKRWRDAQKVRARIREVADAQA